MNNNYDGAKISGTLGRTVAAEDRGSQELRSMTALKEGPEGLTSIIYGRRSYHFERVASAFECLTIALEEAEQDGFQFVLVSQSPVPAGRGDTVASPSMSVPRCTGFSLDSYFQSPL